MSCCQSMFCAADIKNTLFDLTLTSQPASLPLCGSLMVSKQFCLDRQQIPKALNHVTLVADFFASNVLFFPPCWTAPQEFDRSSLLPLRAVCCVSLLWFSSHSPRERHLDRLFNGASCANGAAAFSSLETPCFLYGMKQMWWAERQFTGHCNQRLHLSLTFSL